MDIFASDLDNTLIYSYKRDIGAQKILVERYEGRGVSFMTAKTHHLIDKVRKVMRFIPVTTRSTQQYRRILFSPDWIPQTALTANGGVLLRDGVSDADWYATSQTYTQSAEPALQRAQEVLERDPDRTLDVRRVDGLFVFTKSANVPATLERLRAAVDNAQVELFENGAKVYVVPRALDKGSGVRRLRQQYPQARVFAAGDSVFDLPLLKQADVAFCPQSLGYTGHAGQEVVTVTPQDGIFSDVILQNLLHR